MRARSTYASRRRSPLSRLTVRSISRLAIRTGVSSYDVYRARATASGFTPPIAATEWNSSASEVWVAVDPAQEFAILVRSPGIDSSVMLVSVRDRDGRWSSPRPLAFDGATWLRPYDYRFPFVGHDRSALWLTSATRLFRLPTHELLTQQTSLAGAARLPAMARRPVPALAHDEPELFHPVDLRTTNGISFTPNDSTVYLSRYTDRRDARGRRSIRIFESRRRPGGWTVPSPVAFGEPIDSPVLEEYHPAVTPDGATIYFNSRRQADGSVGESNDLWRSRRTDRGGWRPKEPVLEATSPQFDDYASPVRDGSVYFRSNRPGGAGGGDIYVMRATDGRLHPPELVSAVNSVANENDVSVDADQRLIVFNRFVPETREIDLFASVRAPDGTWGAPRPLTAANTVVDWELTPTLSRDGEYLYVEVSGAIVRWRLDALLTDEEQRLRGRTGGIPVRPAASSPQPAVASPPAVEYHAGVTPRTLLPTARGTSVPPA